jgi:DNA-binding response OmpR family regulator
MSTVIPNQQSAKRNQFPLRRKVLLVSQDRSQIDRWRASLAQAGYAVRACATFGEGAQSLKSERFDFVVLEQGSPAFEGRLVLERAREIDPTVPVLVLARWPEMSCYLAAMESGALDYVEIPLRGQLVRLVDTYLSPHN